MALKCVVCGTSLASSVVVNGPVKLDVDRNKVTRDEQTVLLQPLQTRLFAVVLRRHPHPVYQEQQIAAVWGDGDNKGAANRVRVLTVITSEMNKDIAQLGLRIKGQRAVMREGGFRTLVITDLPHMAREIKPLRLSQDVCENVCETDVGTGLRCMECHTLLVPNLITKGGISYSKKNRRICRGGMEVKLTPFQTTLLGLLLHAYPQECCLDQVRFILWGYPNSEPTDPLGTLHVHASLLTRRISPLGMSLKGRKGLLGLVIEECWRDYLLVVEARTGNLI